VHVIALDFSKAFDTVCHVTLMDKMAQLILPDEVIYLFQTNDKGRIALLVVVVVVERTD